MLESASMTVSNTVASMAGTLSGLWTAVSATVGVVPAAILTVASVVGLYVGISWLWKKAKNAWNNRGVKVVQTPVVNTVPAATV